MPTFNKGKRHETITHAKCSGNVTHMGCPPKRKISGADIVLKTITKEHLAYDVVCETYKDLLSLPSSHAYDGMLVTVLEMDTLFCLKDKENMNKEEAWVRLPDIALGETKYTAYPGDKGKEVYDAVFADTRPVTPPILAIQWEYFNQAGGTAYPPNAGTDIDPIIEMGYKAKCTATYRWQRRTGYKDPTRVDGEFGDTLYDENVRASLTRTVSSDAIIDVHLYADKKGLMVDENMNIVPAKGEDSSSASHKISFRKRCFYGELSQPLSESSLKTLPSKLVEDVLTRIDNVTTSSNGYYIIAYPSIVGDLTNIIMNNSIPVLGAFTKHTLSITNGSGLKMTYNVYQSNNVGAFTDASLSLYL